MATFKRPPGWLVVLVFLVALPLLSWAIVRFDLPHSLLLACLVPYVVSAFYYERRVYLLMTVLLLAASIWVAGVVPRTFSTSLITIAVALLSGWVMAETVHALAVAQALARANLQRQTDESRSLAEIGIALMGCDQADAVFEILGRCFERTLSHELVMINQATSDQSSVITRQIIGLNAELLRQAESLVGFKVIGKHSAIAPTFLEAWFHTRLHKVSGGFVALAASEIPPAVGHTLEALFTLHDVYTIGLADPERIFGNVHIVTRRPQVPLPVHFIEAVVYQCCLTLSRLHAVQELSAGEEQYRLLFQNLSGGCALHEIILDAEQQPCDYRFLRINPAFEELTGLKGEDVIGRTALEVLPGLDPTWIARYGHVAMTGEPAHFEDYSPDLQRHYEIAAYRPKPGHFATVFHDITERKRADAALRDTQALLEQTSRMARVGGWEVNLLTGEDHWSAMTREIHELPDDFVIDGRHGINFYKEGESRSKMIQATNSAVHKGEPFDLELQLVTAKGNERWVRAIGHPEFQEGQCTRLYGTFQDIDARVKSQQALTRYRDHLEELVEREIAERTRAQAARRESESRFRAIHNAANVLIISSDTDGIIRSLNPYACRTLGYQAEELIGQHVRVLVGDEAVAGIDALMGGIAEDSSFQIEGMEQALLSKEGHLVWVRSNLTALRDAYGQAGTILGIGQDITARKQMEEELARHRLHLEELVALRTAELRESQALLDLFFAQSLDGFFFMMLDEPVRWDDTVDKERTLDYVFSHQRITRVNDALLGHFGARSEQLLGRTLEDIFAPDLARGRAWWRDFFDAGYLHLDTAESKLDGTPIWIEGHYVCIYDAEGRISGHFGVMREVSEQRRVVRELEEREHFLAVLNEMTRTALEIHDLPTMLQALADRMDELFEADGCYITLWDEEALATIPVAATGSARSSYRSTPSTPGELTMTESVLRAGLTLVAEDVFNTPYLSPHIAARYPTRSLMAVPLIVGERKLGAVLVGFNTAHRFAEKEIQRAEQASRQIALAVAKAQLYQELEDYAGQLSEHVRARTAELQSQYAQLDAILRSVDEAIFMTDSEQRIRYINPAFTRQTGYSPAEALGQTLAALNTLGEFTSRLPSALSDMTPKKLWQEDVQVRRKDGRRYDAALTIAPVHSDANQVIGHVFTHRDIGQAKGLERARNQFIANVSHQFRTPVTTLRLNVHMMQRTAHLAEQQRYLSMMETNINWLIELIEDTVEISALDSGKGIIVWEPVSLSAIVEEVLRRFQDRAATTGPALVSVPIPATLPYVRGDRARLSRALSELVENAIAFTPVDGEVRVAVQAREQEGEPWATLTVQDTGPGIPEAEKPNVFERFFRGSLVESGHTAGTGLGLSIAQQIVRAHGGQITVESEAGHGSTFTLWLPAAGDEDDTEACTNPVRSGAPA